MALVAVGTFLAQAIATGHVGRTAKRDKAAASGIYLASYYAGGLVGSFVLGQVFDRVGWTACVAVLVAALIAAIGLARVLTAPATDAAVQRCVHVMNSGSERHYQSIARRRILRIQPDHRTGFDSMEKEHAQSHQIDRWRRPRSR